jgi:hypothetical protein
MAMILGVFDDRSLSEISDAADTSPVVIPVNLKAWWICIVMLTAFEHNLRLIICRLCDSVGLWRLGQSLEVFDS